MNKALEILKRFSNINESAYGLNSIMVATLGDINDAIKELDSPRTCDGCIHINIKNSRGYETATCTNIKCTEMYDCDVGSDFCCNYYEPKDNND